MGALLWTGLNVIAALFILYAWIKVFKLLKREIGVGLALLFLLSLSLRGNTVTSDAQSKNLLEDERQSHPIGNWGSSATIPLNTNNQLHLRFEGIRTDSTVRAHGMYSSISGLMIGHEWKPLAGMANSRKQGISYNIFLLHDWKLLGIKLYTSSEEYAGTAAASR